ncbi:hypothetical protein COT72_04425 [archaeon CG10_big_fil_rev_8_21_14_0_10_43_11]|nr:MAG: hypothetical protein COT72_04425 [archaeon CG10_big_fil_rev_8_21_14_0_10_43_11]
MNLVILLLMMSDFFILSGFGLMTPILAIFIKDNIIGGTIFAAGFASTLFFVVKNIIQLPFSRFIDSHDHDTIWLMLGSIIIVAIPLLYIFADHIWMIYMLQVLYGVGVALAYPAWIALWVTHLDKNHESFEWSSYSALIGFGIAITGIIGAAIADYIGFKYTFMLASAVSFFGLIFIMRLFWLERDEILSKKLVSKKKLKRNQKHFFVFHKKRRVIH